MTDVPAKPRGAFRFARELTTLVGAPFVVWVIGWGHEYVFDVTVGVVALLALYEFLDLGRKKGYTIPSMLCLAVAALLIAAFVLEQLSVEIGVFAALLVIPAWYVLFSKATLDDALPASAISVFATLYVGMLGGSLIRMRNDFPEGPRLLFFLMIVVWIGDAGAYYVGRTFGKTRLSPRISPKKSVEGLIGGIVTSMLAAIVIHFTFFEDFPLLHAIGAAIVLGFSGVVGDLAESMWKRSGGVKDSGTLIPGHGGFLDRFDSIFFTAPILYCYWAFTHKGMTTLNIITG